MGTKNTVSTEFCRGPLYSPDLFRMLHLQALDSYVIRGVTHNISLLRDILTEPKFIAGEVTTNYLPEVYPEGFHGHVLDAPKRQSLDAVAGVVFVKDILRQSKFVNQSRLPVKLSTGPSKWSLTVSLDEAVANLTVEAHAEGSFTVTDSAGNSSQFSADVVNFADPLIDLPSGDTIQLISNNHCGDLALQLMGTIFKVKVLEDRFAEKVKYMLEKPVLDLGKFLVAPMPGIIKSVAVKVRVGFGCTVSIA